MLAETQLKAIIIDHANEFVSQDVTRIKAKVSVILAFVLRLYGEALLLEKDGAKRRIGMLR